MTNINLIRLTRWQLVQRLHQEFWLRRHREYLHTITQKSKWSDPATPVKVGRLILLKEDNLPPLKWCIGRIVAVHPGPDQVTRVVTVKTTKGEFKRPVTKVAPLPHE